MRTTSESIEPFVKVYDGTEKLSPLEALDILCELANMDDFDFTEKFKFNVHTRAEAIGRYRPIVEKELRTLEAMDAFNENVCKALEGAFNEISTAKETPR